MAVLDNRIEDPVTATFGSLSAGQVFKYNGAAYIKVTCIYTDQNALNLESFSIESVGQGQQVQPIDAYIDETTP